jgi:hypothetical protein
MVRDYLQEFELHPWNREFFCVIATRPAKGIRFVSDDPAVNAWLELVSDE